MTDTPNDRNADGSLRPDARPPSVLPPDVRAALEAERGQLDLEGVATLLSVMIKRLRRIQAGPLSCREGALALTKIEEALHWLQART